MGAGADRFVSFYSLIKDLNDQLIEFFYNTIDGAITQLPSHWHCC